MNKVKMLTVLSGTTLEAPTAATQAEASRVIVETYSSSKLNFTVAYTTGAGETSNTCSVIVDGYDGTNWVQIGTSANSTGAVTYTASTFNVAGAAAATTYKAHFDVDINFQKIRFGASEAGVSTNKGMVTVVAMVQ
jgi:hypothetical protein